jgi:hypothetical protein
MLKTSTPARRRAGAATIAVTLLAMSASSACTGDREDTSGESLAVRITDRTAESAKAVIGYSTPVETGGFTLPTGAVIPPEQIEGAPAVVPERADALVTPLISGDEGEALIALRVACFARTITSGAGNPGLPAAIDQAIASAPGSEAYRESVTMMATALHGAAVTPTWEDQLTALAVCEAASDETVGSVPSLSATATSGSVGEGFSAVPTPS